MPLEVHSPYQPQGDQPEAIRELVDGLEDGLRFQTLLGATGTGKSVAWHEPVTIRLRNGEAYRGPIGALIDRALGDTQDTSSLELPPPESWEVLAWDPANGRVAWRPVLAMSRHTAPATLFRLATECGRDVTVTGDHSVWVLREGRLHLLPTAEVRQGDALPVPEAIPAPGEALAHIDLQDVLQGARGVSAEVREAVDRLPPDERMARAGEHDERPYGKAYALRHGVKGHRVEAAAATASVERGILADHEVQLGGRRYGGSAALPISVELMTVFGIYVAEGRAADRHALLSVRDPELQTLLEAQLQRLGIPSSRRPDGDFVLGARVWREILDRSMGGSATEKRLPAFWPSLADSHLGALLQGYFEGEGRMDAGALTALTASRRLAGELAEALLRFGIWARVREVRERLPDGSLGTYAKLTVSGARNLGRFEAGVGFLSTRKRAALAGALRVSNANLDLVPGVGDRLRSERLRRGMLQRDVAQRAGISRTMVSAVERGVRQPSRDVFRRMTGALRVTDEAFTGLADVRWSPVATVERVAADGPFVYDLSVDGFETFFTGRGGLFVHNTFTMAKIIERTQRPALILAPNKILTAQLAAEFREYFPTAAVEFFISYYDYYQPEAYVPARDLFIEKDANINMELERLRHSTTRSLLTRRDVIVVASVSAIYGLGSPEEYQKLHLLLTVGRETPRDVILETLVAQQYERNDIELAPGRFRARGDVIEVWAAYEEAPLRVELWGDEVDRIVMIDPVTGDETEDLESTTVFPAKHYVTPFDKLEPAILQVEADLRHRLAYFESVGKLIERQRLRERTLYDLEMLRTLGYCSGIENYSRYLEGRPPGSAPSTLLDYFPDDFITFMDESHVMVSQIRGMYNGDQARKNTLVDYGFRLPAALDNRPLREEEFFGKVGQAVFVSATPADQELELSDKVVEQVIRPTGLVDPSVTVKPSRGQIDDLVFAARERVKRGDRVLVTTLTKRMAESLTEYLAEQGVRVRYMHSDIDALERQVIIRDLRLGHFDVLVGINLLREGLDLPEVSLVAILDADKTGFLRSERSLIQTIGRAARNVNGEVYLYADTVSPAMQAAIDETNRRREKQLAFNERHGITPETIRKRVHDVIRSAEAGTDEAPAAPVKLDPWERELLHDDLKQELASLETEMWAASDALEFERAGKLRDRIREIEAKLGGSNVKIPTLPGSATRTRA